MCAATASTTAGATIASASFAQSILGAGVAAVWGAAMINAGSTVLDHLPHGSFSMLQEVQLAWMSKNA